MKQLIKDNNRVFIGNQIPSEYTTSPYLKNIKNPYAVFKPINEEEIVNIVKYAYNNDIPIIPIGAKTGAVGAQYPVKGTEFIIDLSLMNKIKEFDEKSLTLTVEPGVTLQEIQAEALKHNLFYAPDPASKKSTIGGNVATNAGGMRAVKYGTTRNYVKAINVILADGSLTTLGELTVKNVSGYPLKDLFIGSEGTLGIISEIKLKLIPRPLYEKSLILAFNTLNEATEAVLAILKRGFNPTALELFDKQAIQYSEDFLQQKLATQKGDVYLLITFDDMDQDALNAHLKYFVTSCCTTPVDSVLLTDEEAKKTWVLRDTILYALMQFTKYEMLDEVVPIHLFDEMINYTKELANKHNVTILNFGHAGDGNIHTILLQENISDEIWQVKRVEVLDDIYKKVMDLGGLISAEHGIGILKKDYFLKLTDPIKINLMKQIKKAIDPKGLMNPYKLL